MLNVDPPPDRSSVTHEHDIRQLGMEVQRNMDVTQRRCEHGINVKAVKCQRARSGNACARSSSQNPRSQPSAPGIRCAAKDVDAPIVAPPVQPDAIPQSRVAEPYPQGILATEDAIAR